MVYEPRTCTLYPGRMAEFLRLAETEGFPVLSRHLKPVGWWTSEIGPLNEVVISWAFDDLAQREQAWAAARADERLTGGYFPKVRALMIKQESKILIPTAFSPIR
jgi:hypothetical protein